VFSLVEVALDEADGNFVAISYFWGTSKPDTLLGLTDGTCLAITETVALLLQHIIPNIDGLPVWIDALCIK
jgi:hypothetical protein